MQPMILRCGLLVVALSVLMASYATADETVDAVWQKQEVSFTFLSTEQAYSCDTMKARVEMLLRHLGAGDDVAVSMPPCPGKYGVRKRHRITARFSTLVPVGDGGGEIVKATWSEVELGPRRPQSIDGSECELLANFVNYLLPSFEHEVIEGMVRCRANQFSTTGHLKLKVLIPFVPDEADEAEQEAESLS